MELCHEPVIQRFLEYVKVPTMSCENAEKIPSTDKQFVLAGKLADEMKEMGLVDVYVDDHCYVYGTLRGTVPEEDDHPVIGMIAHMDTSSEAADSPIRPDIRLYEGKDLCINEEKGLFLSKEQFPELEIYRGKHLIVTDGTTLLGGDDKCGIAEILTAIERIIREGIPHRTIKVGFTPDEEVGRGAELFDIPAFGADFAYTVDGGILGELQFENFNAASADITIHGVNVHPGSAKEKMKNAALLAAEFIELLPKNETPATTENYQGFFHLLSVKASVEEAKLHYIIRDHDRDIFEARKKLLVNLCANQNKYHGDGTFELRLTDSYFNMREEMEKHPEVIERARRAYVDAGVKPLTNPIRGGTDGATLTLKGLPCPNLGTGDNNAHSRFEYVCAEDMITMADVIYRILTD